MGDYWDTRNAIMIYSTAKWEHTRQVILRRDKYQCQECKRYGKLREGKHIHHIFPHEYRSLRSMPGLRVIPLVITTTSLLAVAE